MTATVTLIFDPEFGDRLRLVRDADVWIVRSPANSPVVESLWSAGDSRSLTAFDDYRDPDVERFDEILRSIELHHGKLSQDPPFARLTVVGMEYDEGMQASLRNVGFHLVEKGPSGFTARRGSA